jgi:hypothetical protein
MSGHLLDREAVKAANMAYYQAFEENDLDAMVTLWEHSNRVTCVHPGWPMVRGWDDVFASWKTLLVNEPSPQFIVTNELVHVIDDFAWVTCDENILDEGTGTTTATMNLFALSEGRWQMVSHIGSRVELPQNRN